MPSYQILPKASTLNVFDNFIPFEQILKTMGVVYHTVANSTINLWYVSFPPNVGLFNEFNKSQETKHNTLLLCNYKQVAKVILEKNKFDIFEAEENNLCLNDELFELRDGWYSKKIRNVDNFLVLIDKVFDLRKNMMIRDDKIIENVYNVFTYEFVKGAYEKLYLYNEEHKFINDLPDNIENPQSVELISNFRDMQRLNDVFYQKHNTWVTCK
jgi:hypothetical protein